MMPKSGMEVAQDYTFFNYGSPITWKYLKYQERTILAWPGMKPAPIFLLENIKITLGNKLPQMN